MPASKHDLVDWVRDALRDNDGAATIVDVCEHIWKYHAIDLQAAGALFFTWQYDVRRAADKLRRCGELKQARQSPKGLWELT